MYLKSLELHGFKSFPEKTVIRFDHGSTIIVGPNGSGKSNITDAMRWVLGEVSSKNLRGSKMEDVIFLGADGYRQMSFAEVSVTFDDSEEPKKLNSQYDEITVTRRFYRNSESEYFINRNKVRLKDINELFMNTGIGRDGYSIIGQGRIAEIISKKSDERRGVFEETAGISKYRYRKHETERKLQETEGNMTRVSDILGELEARVGPMERAAQKARKYIELFEIKKQADVSLWLYDLAKMREDIARLENECAIAEHELEIAEDSIKQYEAQIEHLYDASRENLMAQNLLNEDIKSIREKIFDAENRYKVTENNISHAKINVQNENDAREKLEKSLDTEKESLSQLKDKLTLTQKSIEDITEKTENEREHQRELTAQKSEKESSLAQAFEEIKLLEARKNELQVRLRVLSKVLSEHDEKSDTINEDISKYEAEILESDKKLTELDETLSEYGEAISEINEKLSSFDREINSKFDETERYRIELNRLESEKASLESRINALSGMIEHFDGYNNSVKYVMNEKSRGNLRGIHGPISHLIKVPEKYTVAVETSLGASLQSIVVDNEENAKSAIRALKNSGSGRATFYPISSVRGRRLSRELEDASSCTGFVDYANNLCTYDEKYSEILSSLLGSIAVFDNIDNATASAKRSSWKIRCVTLDGQQINAGGSFTGGSTRRESGILTRNTQIEKLKSELSESVKKCQNSKDSMAKAKERLDRLKSERYIHEEKLKILEAMVKSEDMEAKELRAKRELTSGLVDKLRSDSHKLSDEKETSLRDTDTLSGELEDISREITRISEERSSSDGERHSIEAEITEATDRINSLLIEEATAKRDEENILSLITDSEGRISSMTSEISERAENIERLSESMEGDTRLLSELKESAEKFRSELEGKEQERISLEEGGMDFEKRNKEASQKLRNITSKKELTFAAYTKTESKLQLLKSDSEKMSTRIYDEYELTHTTAQEMGYPPVTKENRNEVQAKLNEMKASIRSLGPVNVDAIEEYAELKERYEYVKTQLDDLISSKNDLDSIINSIDDEMKRMFTEAFTKINKYFGEVFVELFGGGHAELTLTDPEDVLNCGIEISAAPPGKMVKNLSLLSGGEQAFVAIALMFALIKVNPSPFCIFDEIEAALDEVNVNRVAKYISRISNDIQVIMITHRRGTMEIANTLYGVTMPRRGVSKVFTLDTEAVSKEGLSKEFTDEVK